MSGTAAAVVASHVFGLKADVADNVCYQDDQNIIYPSGATAVIYNIDQHTQRFIPGTEGSNGFSAMAVSPNRRYVALAERLAVPAVTVFDLHSLKKRKVLSVPEADCSEYTCLAFSPDSKYLVTLSSGPDYTLAYWAWEKSRGPMATTRATLVPDQPAHTVTFNPQDNTQLCVTGDSVLKLFRYTEGHLKPMAFQKQEPQNFLSQAWLSEDRLVVANDSGQILLFDGGELKAEFSVTDGRAKQDARVEAIASFSRGFVCVGPGPLVHVFEASEEKALYKKERELTLPPTWADHANIAKNLAVSPSEDEVLIATGQHQLFTFSLNKVDSSDLAQEGKGGLKLLSQQFHHGEVTGLASCVRKPLVATCSLDRSVRIWNYLTKSLDLVKYFSDKAHCVAMHPSGLHIVVGFDDKLRFLNLLVDDIRAVKEFSIRCCNECKFSRGGDRFAAVQGNVIQVFSSYTFRNLATLKGHNGRIQSLCWRPDDARIVSCSADGAVYEWDMRTMARVEENVLKTCSYSSVATSEAGLSYAVGSDSTLKAMASSEVQLDVPSDVLLTQVAVSASGRLLLTGAANGTVRSYKHPLASPAECTSHPTHSGAVSKLAVSADDQYVFSTGKDGCLFIHSLVEMNERGVKRDKEGVFAEEVLISKADLDETTALTTELKTQVEELKMANEYQLRLKDMNLNEQVKEITDSFEQEVAELRAKLQKATADKEKLETAHDHEVTTIFDGHQRELQTMESTQNQKLMAEYEKYQGLQRKSTAMQEAYEAQLATLAQQHETGMTETVARWEDRLAAETTAVDELNVSGLEARREFEELRRQIELDADKEILVLKNRYEQQLRDARENNLQLKGDNGIMRKKFRSLQDDIDNQRKLKLEMDNEQRRLHGLIGALEKDYNGAKKEIEERDETIQEKEKRIYDLKKKTQELEKFKFVLGYKIKELKKQIEPRENEIKEMKGQVAQMDQELEKYHKQNKKLELRIVEMNEKLGGSDIEIAAQRASVAGLKNTITRFKADLDKTSKLIQEPKPLVQSVRRLYDKYCGKETKLPTTPIEEDAQAEYNRQRVFLERNIASLRKKLAKSDDRHQQESMRIMKENAALIKEINQLRAELKSSKRSEKLLEGTLRSTQKLAGMRGQTVPFSNVDLITTAAASTLAQTHDASQVDRIVDIQKEEIRRLREELQHASSRPQSTGRLPALEVS